MYYYARKAEIEEKKKTPIPIKSDERWTAAVVVCYG